MKQAVSQYLRNFHTIGKKINNFCWRTAWKDCMCSWVTILESHGRLDKIVCWRKCQSKSLASAVGIFFEFFMLLGLVFQFLKVRLIKICKIELLDLLFLVVFISFYISRYHFSQIFRTSFGIIHKKDFRHKFSFLTDSLKLPTPLTAKIC